MKGWTAVLAGLILAGAALTGCGHRIDGTVVTKYHNPQYVTYVPICTGKGICVPTPLHHAECWGLAVRDAVDPKRTDYTCVDRAVWARTNVGDHYWEKP